MGLVACGGSGGEPAPAASQRVSTVTLPPGTKAAGTPVRIGFITGEGGSLVSIPEIRESAQAAVTYANAYLGGIAGRPIELVICKSLEDPASAGKCANQMVSQKVAGVVIGTTGFGDAIVPLVAGAGIPYFTVSGNSAAELTNADAFSWTGGFPSVLAGMAQYAKEQNLHSVALFVTDAAVTAAKQFGTGLFAKAGVSLDIVSIPRGTPDVTSQITAAVGKKPAAVGLIGEATHCIAVLKGLQTVGFTGKTMVIQPCIAQSVENAAPGALDGVINFGAADIDSDDPDTVLYRTVMAKYAPNTSPEGYAVTGYQSMLGLVRALSGMTGPVTPQAIAAKVRSAKDVKLPAGHGLTFSCTGAAVPGLKSLCSVNSVVMTIKDLKGTNVQLVDAASLFTP